MSSSSTLDAKQQQERVDLLISLVAAHLRLLLEPPKARFFLEMMGWDVEVSPLNLLLVSLSLLALTFVLSLQQAMQMVLQQVVIVPVNPGDADVHKQPESPRKKNPDGAHHRHLTACLLACFRPDFADCATLQSRTPSCSTCPAD